MALPTKLPDSVDESVWYVMLAMVGALFLGGLFLVFAIQISPSVASGEKGAATVSDATTAPPAPGTASTAAARPGTETAAPGSTPATETKPGAGVKSATDTKPATGAVRGAATASGTTNPDAGAADHTAATAPSESAKTRIVADDRTRNAARWAGLLWAFACCAVGAFLGFIFGIPRSLSSDTARTTVAAQTRPAESASARAAALVKEKEEAARKAEELKTKVDEADTRLNDLRVAAGAGAASDQRVKDASAALVALKASKASADALLAEKTNAAQKAEDLVKKDQAASSSAASLVSAVRTEPVHTRAPSTAVNTNLEQISDWLTKIIVGVSLVNSDRVGRAMIGVAEAMAGSFGGPGSRSLALATLTYFGVIGLLGGYLLTRLFLQRAFEALGSANLVEQTPG